MMKHRGSLYQQGTDVLGPPFSMKAAQVVIFRKSKTGQFIVNGKPNLVAPLMYKTVMWLATFNDNATITALKTKLCELKQYMIKFDEIHTYFDQNYTQLKALGQSIDDDNIILFDNNLLGIGDATFHDEMQVTRYWMDQQGNMRDATHETS